ncbi:MAG: tetratricopeptide repeat protein [Deltaproteobacteria bacterium]|nr:tetratricopeptide repeat protein [Deltaproteobacteria bacterium]
MSDPDLPVALAVTVVCAVDEVDGLRSRYDAIFGIDGRCMAKEDDNDMTTPPARSSERVSGFYSAGTAGSLHSVPSEPEDEIENDDTSVPLARISATTCKPSVLAPFAVLLPRLGEVQSLVRFRDVLVSRSRWLHGREPTGGTEEGLRAFVNEEGMLSQALQWFGMQGEWDGTESSFDYSQELFVALYELGRMYYDMGYFGASERIFLGLSGVDRGLTPSRVGVGVVRLERSAFQDAQNAFRSALRDPHWQGEAKIGLAAAFLSRGETDRAATILSEIRSDVTDAELRKLWRALFARCTP